MSAMSHHLQNLRRFYMVFASFMFVILLTRLTQLQIVNRDEYFRESEQNRVRDVILKPVRGQIFDRNGKLLVANRPAYSVSVIPYEFLKSDSTIKKLAAIINIAPEEIKKRIEKNKIGDFSPVKLVRDVNFELLSRIEEYRLNLPGVFYSTESKRYYPAGIKAPHLFGYLGEITTNELHRVDGSEYKRGDVIGKNGLEFEYEKRLRGASGVQYVEVDVLGREIRNLPELSSREPQSGEDVLLTIDADIQRYLEKAMEGKTGAAVVLDSRTGGLLAMVSKPDYDPEIFSSTISNDVWNSLVNDPGKPLYNRACQSLYPPGSTYKLVLAAAGLETGILDVNETVVCKGYYRLGNRSFACWKKGGHGEVNFYSAVEQSCNVYFYQLGLKVGLANWAKYSNIFNFGRLTNIDLPNESAGIVPTKEYFDKKYGKKGWTKGLLLNLSVGQGDLLVTPLQMAYFIMTVGNEGVAYRPHFIEKFSKIKDKQKISEQPIRIQGISAATFEKIKTGMYLVVNGEHGTAKRARIPGVDVCGKTGSAQNSHGESHAWFVGFAPMEHPQIALCVLVENGGSGGAVAGPIAGGVLRTYFKKHQFANH